MVVSARGGAPQKGTPFLLVLGDYHAVVLVDAVLRHHSAYAGGGVDVAVAAYDSARVADAVAAYFNVIAQHRAELLDACFYVLSAVVDNDQFFIGFDVGGDGARAHVAVVAEDGIAYVVVVRCLDVVEEYYVLELHGVADDAVSAHKGGAADERAVPDLGVGTDDAGRTQISAGEDLGGLVDPDALGYFGVFLGIEGGAERLDEFLYSLESFPGVFVLGKVVLGQCMFQVEKIGSLVHKIAPWIVFAFFYNI